MITGVVIALVVIVAILVGLPLLAWWVGNRRYWRKLRPSPTPVLHDELKRRLGLTGTELLQAQRAANSGRVLADPKLRPAVVAVAEQSLERHRPMVILGRAAAVVGVLALVVGLVVGEFQPGAPVLTSVVWVVMVVNLFVQAGTALLTVRRLRRGIELNSDRDGASRQNGSGGPIPSGRADS